MNYCNQWNNLEQPGLFTFYLQQQNKTQSKIYCEKANLCQNKIHSTQKNIKIYKVLPKNNSEITRTYSTKLNKLNKKCSQNSNINQSLSQQKIQPCSKQKQPIIQSESKIFHKSERKKGIKIPINNLANNFNFYNKTKETIRIFQKATSQVLLSPATARAHNQSRKKTQIPIHNLTPRYQIQRTIHQAQNLTFNTIKKKNSFMEFLLTKKAKIKILKPKEPKRQKVDEILNRFFKGSKQKVLSSSFL